MFDLSSVRQAVCGLVIMVVDRCFVCMWMRFMNRLPFCIALVAVFVLLIHSQYLYVAVYSPERTKQLRIMLDMVK